MTVLPVDESMLPAIKALEDQCFSTPWTLEQLQSQLRPGHLFLAAVEGDELLGYVGCQYVLDEGYISNVAVSPLHRRRGVARQLLLTLSAQARALELSFLTLEVRESNAPAIALYERCGYQRVGLRKNYYKKPTEHAILMTWEI